MRGRRHVEQLTREAIDAIRTQDELSVVRRGRRPDLGQVAVGCADPDGPGAPPVHRLRRIVLWRKGFRGRAHAPESSASANSATPARWWSLVATA